MTEPGRRERVAEPENSDDAVQEATGRGWDEWCDLIDAWDGRHEGHSAIAAHLGAAHGLDGWWAQAVTVGYERITGLRLPYQRPDGTFTASASRTLSGKPSSIRARLLDPAARADLFPDLETELRSKPTSKAVRLSVGPGVAVIAVDAVAPDRVRVSVAHERLPGPEEVTEWKSYWSAWLDALDAG